MARPKQCRRVRGMPEFTLFKPAGIPGFALVEVELSVDEFEALRLADYEGLYQAQAAERMGISRPTFGRIVDSARRKSARALVEGCALRIEGGAISVPTIRRFACKGCGHAWELPSGTGRPAGCPACAGQEFIRAVLPGAGE